MRNLSTGSWHTREADTGHLSSQHTSGLHDPGTGSQQTGKAKSARHYTKSEADSTHACSAHGCVRDEASRQSKTKRHQREILIGIGKRARKKTHTIIASQGCRETGTLEALAKKKCLQHQADKPQGFERHPSNPYYMCSNKDDDPDDDHAHDNSFDDDSGPAFTPKQISILKSTMMDFHKDFKESRNQRMDLNQTLNDFSEKLPTKSRSVAKPSPSTR